MHHLSKDLRESFGIVHFVGIGGIGMSGIAEIMHNLGYIVQGSDNSFNSNTERLSNLGIKIFLGQHAENVANASYVVISSAVKEDNPEVRSALEKHIPVLRRAEMLAELLRFKTAVSISGSHGKTTTTSLVACMFEQACLEPTVINGGIINNRSTNAYVGSGEYIIAEADESDATFIKIPSTIGVITNIDPEHMDYYKTFDNLLAAFEAFITNLPFYGFAVVCIDHPIVRDLVAKITSRKIITYGIESEDAHIRAFNIRRDSSSSTYDVKIRLPRTHSVTTIENIYLPTVGIHNVLNSLAAVAIAAELDFGIKVISEGFKKFHGVKRRFTKVAECNGVTIIDDYAHHPAEVKATLATARSVVKPGNKVIAIFQPHRFSRMHSLFDDFAACFDQSDKVYIADIYSAGESPIEGISSSALVNKIKGVSSVEAIFLADSTNIAEIVKKEAKPGDFVIFMGAGNITQWAYALPGSL